MNYYKNDPRAIAPSRAYKEDSGLDLYALEDVEVAPGEVKTIRTGICFGLVAPGFVFDKSSRGSTGLKVLGGVLDLHYVGEVSVIVSNMNLYSILQLLATPQREIDRATQVRNALTEATIRIPYGKALAQVVLSGIVETPGGLTELSEEHFKEFYSYRYSDRGERGFGSSDRVVPQEIVDQYRRIRGFVTESLRADLEPRSEDRTTKIQKGYLTAFARQSKTLEEFLASVKVTNFSEAELREIWEVRDGIF